MKLFYTLFLVLTALISNGQFIEFENQGYGTSSWSELGHTWMWDQPTGTYIETNGPTFSGTGCAYIYNPTAYNDILHSDVLFNLHDLHLKVNTLYTRIYVHAYDQNMNQINTITLNPVDFISSYRSVRAVAPQISSFTNIYGFSIECLGGDPGMPVRYDHIEVTLLPDFDNDGVTIAGGDCDDTDAAINPGTVWYPDSDGDAFGDASAGITGCIRPGGNYIIIGQDCNDMDGSINPNATEITCNGIDENCNGMADDAIGCVPPTRVADWQGCPLNLNTMDDWIYCNSVANAESYMFRFSDGANVFIKTINASTNKIRPSWVSGVLFGTSYTVDVRAKVGGVWGDFDATCQITTPSAPAMTTTLGGVFCPGSANLSQYVYCGTRSGVSAYMFKVTDPATGALVAIKSYTINKFKPAWLGLQGGTTYNVQVNMKYNGTYQGWGAPCTLSINAARPGEDMDWDAIMAEEALYLVDEDLNTAFNPDLTIYPNPSENGGIANIHGANFFCENAVVEIFDISGKRIASKPFMPNNGMIFYQFNASNELKAGIYIARVSGDNGVYQNERLIIK